MNIDNFYLVYYNLSIKIFLYWIIEKTNTNLTFFLEEKLMGKNFKELQQASSTWSIVSLFWETLAHDKVLFVGELVIIMLSCNCEHFFWIDKVSDTFSLLSGW